MNKPAVLAIDVPQAMCAGDDPFGIDPVAEAPLL